MRWFRSRKITSPVAKSLGGIWLLTFIPALLALLPGHVRWMGVIPIEGLVGRIVGDVLIHYFNLAGAYIVCATILAVALYLSTAFSFAALQVWAPTRFAFVIALWDRWKDWQAARAKKKMQQELEKRRAARPTVTAQLVQARAVASEAPSSSRMVEPSTTGIERMAAPERSQPQPQPPDVQAESELPAPEVSDAPTVG